jgi:hypothetical protein
MLLMWFITAQSIEASGYELTSTDRIFLQNIFATIDNKIDTQDQLIEKKMATYLTYFPSNSRQNKLLHEIYDYINKDNKDTSTPAKNIYTKEMIHLLSEQF